MKKYWILRIEWSQTDHEYKIVHTDSAKSAIAKYTYPNGPRYVTCYGSVDEIS